MISLAHVINPVAAPAGSELDRCQPLVFESMRAASAVDGDRVEVIAVGYDEDRAMCPDQAVFHELPETSLRDLLGDPSVRKLPRIADILRTGAEATAASHLIYTNTDIVLQPSFYAWVRAELDRGVHDALVINRRRVAERYETVDDLPALWADPGLPHPGFDCFVCPRSWVDDLVLDDLVVGVPFVGVGLAHNVFARAENPWTVHGLQLTKHVGLDVLPPVDERLKAHNRAAFERVRAVLQTSYDLQRFPYAHRGLAGRGLGWALNPSIFVRDWRRLEGRGFARRLKTTLDEVRWRVLDVLGSGRQGR